MSPNPPTHNLRLRNLLAAHGNTLILALACVVALLVILAAEAASAQARARHHSSEQQLIALGIAQAQRRADKARYKTYASRYAAYRARQYLGPMNRLQWIDTLQQLQRQLLLPQLRYTIDVPKSLPLADKPEPSVQLLASEMDITLGLWHAADLWQFLHELQRQAPSLVTVQSCTLVRKHTQPQPAQSNIDARCQLLWHTLDTSGWHNP